MAGGSSRPLPFTANPLLLMINDLMLFAQITFTWPITAGLPSIILPVFPTRSGALDELALTGSNLWALSLHGFLVVAQILFLLSLVPLAFILLPILYLVYVIGFVAGNQWFTALLNGRRQQTGLFQSNPDCVRGKPAHANERWVFINGVAAGRSWLQSNLDLLAMTFRRPVYGIHNQTRGIIFDVLECIIQRDLSYATLDIRQAYAALVDILSEPNVNKVVLIVHSQGAIEGGMVLDWLYTTVAAQQLRKLEIYTFGNAANHWNAPVISSLNVPGRKDGTAKISSARNGDGTGEERIIKYIEHYANEGDYVARFGILHFLLDQAQARPQPSVAYESGRANPVSITSGSSANGAAAVNSRIPLAVATSAPVPSSPVLSPKTPIERLSPEEQERQENNRFFGRLFKRAGSGHQLNQHYLDNLFEMEGLDPNDFAAGRVKDGNAYMDAEVDLGALQWDTVQAVSGGQGNVKGGIGRGGEKKKQVKELSRLWAYRNGGDPDG